MVIRTKERQDEILEYNFLATSNQTQMRICSSQVIPCDLCRLMTGKSNAQVGNQGRYAPSSPFPPPPALIKEFLDSFVLSPLTITTFSDSSQILYNFSKMPRTALITGGSTGTFIQEIFIVELALTLSPPARSLSCRNWSSHLDCSSSLRIQYRNRFL